MVNIIKALVLVTGIQSVVFLNKSIYGGGEVINSLRIKLSTVTESGALDGTYFLSHPQCLELARSVAKSTASHIIPDNTYHI